MTDAPTGSAQKPLLLIVDDPPVVGELVSSLGSAFEIVTSHSRSHCAQGLHALGRAPELALVGLGWPPSPRRPEEGFALITDLLGICPSIRIIVLAERDETDNARHARALGAADFVTWPCGTEDLFAALRQASICRVLEKWRETPIAAPLIGTSAATERLKRQLLQCADSPFPVLIEGESGTRKEALAGSYLHHRTKRDGKPFLAVNCAAVPPALLEPMLFGHAKDAFPGADTARPGYFENAADGTLFLDRIGGLSLELQARLQRVLENGAFHRLGETLERSSRARIIAASHRDLYEEVKAGRFRADLYYRLSACRVNVPPLREMGADKLLLLDHFRHLYAARAQRPAFEFCEEARQCWLRYAFPGNLRELRDIVIRLIVKHPGRIIARTELEAELDVQEEPAPAIPPLSVTELREDLLESAMIRLRQPPFSLDRLLAETERSYVEAALRLADGNGGRAARLLGLDRAALYDRMAFPTGEP
ncbi:MAG: sigma-54 dependent transcriptional regulator [Candidatus Accumulibacter sp.]|jgi:two-component system nitrogen regulation response regulator GlnG|nr:sigma-54 dependent transcriptional regulator [Accumulibacter sp.]